METKQLPLVVSFYTEQTPYELYGAQLRESCEQFGLENCIVGIPSQGSWELNCAYKPFFLSEQLTKHERPLLWIDADGLVEKRFEEAPFFQSDLAVFMDQELSVEHPSYVRSGTIYCNYTQACLKFLSLWKKICFDSLTSPHRKEIFWDQIALKEALILYGDNICIKTLPLSYLFITDHPIDQAKESAPYIRHLQASRAQI